MAIPKSSKPWPLLGGCQGPWQSCSRRCWASGAWRAWCKKTDATFLLPKTTEFPKYLTKARRYSLGLPLVVLTFATIAGIPMLKVLNLQVFDAIALGVSLWAFKDADLWLQVLSFYQARQNGPSAATCLASRWSRWGLAFTFILPSA